MNFILLGIDLTIILIVHLMKFDERLEKEIEEEKKGFKEGKPIL